MNIEEASRTEPFRAALAAGRLFHVHVGDNNRLPPGRGLIDFATIVDTLHGAGYHGYLSAELLAEPDGDTARARRSTICGPWWRVAPRPHTTTPLYGRRGGERPQALRRETPPRAAGRETPPRGAGFVGRSRVGPRRFPPPGTNR